MLDDIIKKVNEELTEKQQELIIDNIIDIYNGEFKDYDTYRDTQLSIIHNIEEAELKQRTDRIKNNYVIRTYVRPYILTKALFDYIVSQGGQRK